MAIALNRGTSKRGKFPFVKSLGKVLPWFARILTPKRRPFHAGKNLVLETLEQRVTPTVSYLSDFAERPQSSSFLFNGSDPGVSAVVNSYYSNSNQLAFQTSVMGSGFTGGVRVGMGDINHDGMPDIVAAAGPGGGPRVQVLNGSTGASLSGTIGSFYAYDTAFSGGVQIAIADVNLDGYDDVITAPGAGGGPNVKIFSGYDASVLASFYAFDSAFTGGVTIATADYNGDGQMDLVVAPGVGGGPNVKIYDLSNLGSIGTIPGALGSFWAFDSSFTGGVTLGTNPTYPDLTGDGIPDILVAQGPGTGSLVRVIDGSSGSVAAEFSPLGTVTTGLRVATGLVNNDSIPDIVVGKVSGVSTNPLVYSGVTFAQNTSLSVGTVTPLGTVSGKGGIPAGTSDLGGTSVSATGSFTVGGIVNIDIAVAGTGFDTPTGNVNLTVNYPDAALTVSYGVTLTGSGIDGVATIPITVAAGGSMIINSTYGGDTIYHRTWLPIKTGTTPDVGTAPNPAPIRDPGSDPVGATSPRIMQTVMPIQFGAINPAGYDGYWLLSTNDLPGGGLLGLNRTWSSKPNLPSGAVGTGSTIADMPRLKMGTGSLVQLIVNSSKAYEFDSISGGYSTRFRQPFKLYPQAGSELVMATDSGRVFTFFDFSSSVPTNQRGMFKSMMDEGGNLTSVQSWDSSGRPTEVSTVNVTASPSVTESIVYTYSTTSPNAGMLSSATLRRKVGTGSYATVMTATYAYHDGTTTSGSAQDLKSVEIKNASSETVDYQYYRYYTNSLTTGYNHALKYALGFSSYKRIINDLGNPDSLTDSQLSSYADHYFEYVSGGNGRISKHVIAGDGNSESSGGLGAYTYNYTTSSGTTPGLNIWKTMMIETNPDGAVTTTYSNAAGQVLLSSFKESSSSTLEWAKYNHYDAYGSIDLQAEPSAVDTGSLNARYKNTWGDLVNFNSAGVASALKTGEGLIKVYTYGSEVYTTATTTSAGTAPGYLSSIAIKRGQSGLINKLKSYEYINHTGNNVNTYVVANAIDYPEEATPNVPLQAGVTTNYAYNSWYSYSSGALGTIESAQPKMVTVTLPIVSTSQNGPGGTTAATMRSVYDVYGRIIWTQDAGGYLNYTQYDAATIAPIKSISDVNTYYSSDFSNLPSGWSSLGSGGLHLKSTAEVDAYGRPIKTTDPNGNVNYTVYKDANQEMRVYSGWNGTATIGPILLLRNDLASGYSEALTYYTNSPDAQSGRPTGAEAVTAITSLTRSYTNIAGQTTAADSYFNLSGFTYSMAGGLGAEGTNYLRMRYAYDDGGRQNRSQTPSGTITRAVYDKLGRITTTWTGLDDSPTSGVWSPGNTGGTDLVKTTEVKYDQDASGNSGVGDSNLTSVTEYPGGGASNRTTRMWYDWRNRVGIVKSGAESSENTSINRRAVAYSYNNWDDFTGIWTYDADGLAPSLVNGIWSPGIPYTSYSILKYDDLGRLYRTEDYNIASPMSNATRLVTDYWYDSRGNTVKTSAPGGLVTEAVYDGVRRLTASYLSNGGGGTSYNNASSVTGDSVLSQTEITYDSNSNPIMVTTRDRFHNASGTGALDSTTSRASYSTAYYDSLDRVTSAINVGTNGSSAYSRPSTAPSSSSTVLRTDYGYNSATGLLEKVTDPKGIESKSYYDAMGRTTKTVEANDGGAITATTNKTTEFGYDSYGHLSTVKAYRASSDYSQTQYVYGVTTSASGINNNDILSSIRYPDKSSGNASSSITENFTVNALGEVRTATDRLGTTHTYTRDVMGRLTKDEVTTLGSGVDGSITRIETAYNSQGMAYLFTSYGSSGVVNQVQDVFNNLGQLIKEYQEHAGTVSTSGSLSVGYSYVEGGTVGSPKNNSRLTGMVYPNGRSLTYDYGSPGGTNDQISRLEAVKDGSTTLESYQYLGLNNAVVRSHPQPGVDLTYVTQTSGMTGDAGDQYTGLDRFGRIVDQVWVKNTTPTPTITDRFQYGYDRNGNVLYKNNLVLTAQSELYHANGATAGYDNLNQLSSFARGTLTDINSDGIPDTIASPGQSQSFTPDGQGNFTTVTTNGTGVTRTYDKQNELTAVGSTNLTYDAAGNLKTDEQNRTYVYDAWNRLISVSSSGTSASYVYDALGRRIKEISGSETRDLYYSTEWQVIEERITNSSQTLALQVQNVWSPVYVDAMIERDRDTGTDGVLDERLYVQTDANFNVTALVSISGAVVQRFVYDPYGKVTVLSSAWAAQADGYKWQYLHQGGRQDSVTGLLNFRNRDYSTSLMRWTTNDPIGFGGGDTNTYRYLGNSPSNALDPSGLAATSSSVAKDQIPGVSQVSLNSADILRPNVDLKSLNGQGITYMPQVDWPVVNGKKQITILDVIFERYETVYKVMRGTGSSHSESVYYAVAIMAADFTGITSIEDARVGRELLTNRELSTTERVIGMAGGILGVIGTVSFAGPIASVISKALPKGQITSLLTKQFDLLGFMNSVNCFPDNTPVWTEFGLRPICEVNPGDNVWSYDFENGEWQLSAVSKRDDSDYDAELITLDVGLGEVTTTANHPFWVIAGEDLHGRPVPQGLAPDEDQGGALEGRWVDSHRIRVGDVVFLHGRGASTVNRVFTRHEKAKVCNLTVPGLHTFTVGEAKILVHNHSASADAARAKVASQIESVIRKWAGFADNGTPLIIDECNMTGGVATATALRSLGYNIRTVLEIFGVQGIKDPIVKKLAEILGGKVLTHNVRDYPKLVRIKVPHTKVNSIDGWIQLIENGLKGLQ